VTDEAGSRDMEQYVSDRWKLVHQCDGSYRHYLRGTILLQEVHGQWLDFDSWQAAYAFTLEREKQIAEVNEEIEAISAAIKVFPFYLARLERTFNRLAAALVDLQRGMKPLAGEAR